MRYFGDHQQTIYHQKLACQYSPNNTQFIMQYITCLCEANSDGTSECINNEILLLFKKLLERIELFQQIKNKSDTKYNIPHFLRYLLEFPYLSFLRSFNKLLNYDYTSRDHEDYFVSLNQFISCCYDKYVSFHSISNENDELKQIFKYAEICMDLSPKHWNRRSRLALMYLRTGRYLNSLYHIEWILNIFEIKGSKHKKIIESIYPMRMSKLYLVYLEVLLRLEKFEKALERYEYVIDNELIDEADNLYFAALKIELFARLSIYSKSVYLHIYYQFRIILPSTTCIQIAMNQYNFNKHLAMIGSANTDIFHANYGFLLMICGRYRDAMHVLEEEILISNDVRGWIEYLNGYLQHYKLKQYQHAKYHYYASFMHNHQIPEVRYHLTVLMMKLKEYKMAYLQLKKGINMESGLPIINGNGDKLLRKLRKKLKRLKCGNCGRCYYSKSKNEKKLSICKGCGKYYYCNKKCQKRHWKIIHRLQCDKSYQEIFKMLKNKYATKCIYYY